MRILVTGGTGFLGQHVVKELRACGHEPIAIGSDDANLVSQDDADYIFRETQPNMVFHLAAKVGGIGANQQNPARYWSDNLSMGINVLEQCYRFKVEKLVMVGTVCSYPKYACEPFLEEGLWDGYPEETNAPYGIAKKALLVGAQAYREQYGMNTIFLMPANLYGPGDNFTGKGGHVIADLIHKFHTERSGVVSVWGDGEATRDFLYVSDAAYGICKAAWLYNGSWPVNLGTGRSINIRDLARDLKTLCGFKGEVAWDHAKPNGQPHRVLDTTRAKALFGWQAGTSLEKGLKTTVKWYRENILPSSDKHGKVKVK